MKTSFLLPGLVFVLSAPGRAAEAAGDAVPDRPFANTQQELKEINATVPGAVSMPRIDLDSAGLGNAVSPNFTTPAPAPLPKRTDSEPASAANRSSGWLMDALRENARRADTNRRPASGTETNDDGRAPTAEGTAVREQRPGSALTPAIPVRPSLGTLGLMAQSMPSLLNPVELRRWQETNSLLSGGSGSDSTTDPMWLAGIGGNLPTNTPAANAAAPVGDGLVASGLTRRPANPYLPALEPPVRVSALPGQSDLPKIASPAPASVAPPPLPAPPPPAVPPPPNADDRKYFPQLKRF